MKDDKLFLTYNQQMRKLRNDKHIDCAGSIHKKILIRAGYFNIVNGYKTPFISGQDANGNHIYISGTSISQLQAVKQFDDQLRSFLLKYITQIEEETRTLAGYKFDKCKENGKIPWYDTNAYSPNKSLQEKMSVISKAYNELSRSQLDYVKFYMDNHKQIPIWIMIKVDNFSTFIDIIQYSKTDVSHSLCHLYGLEDEQGRANVKLLIGSLHWMRKIRNACKIAMPPDQHQHMDQKYPFSHRHTKLLLVYDLDLADFHGGKRLSVALRRNARTTGSINNNRCFRQKCLD